MADLSTDNGYWVAVPMTCSVTADRETWCDTYEGYEEPILNLASSVQVGDVFTITDDELSSGIYQDGLVCTGVSVSRKMGGLCEVTFQYAALYKLEVWNVDFAEVSKDIKTWLVEQYTNKSTLEIDRDVWKEIGKINQWEMQRSNEAWDPWSNFLYDGKNKLGGKNGWTLKLAEKIMKGVTNYIIYAPVITRTRTFPFRPYVGTIGKISKPKSEDGWHGFNNETLPSDWTELAKEWLKTAERSTSNQDGTFTLVEQWQGADQVDHDLYQSLNVGE